MRNLIMVFAVAAIGLGESACAYNPPPVPVYASRADWEILAGHWQGTYTTLSSGRRGVIEFTLSAGDEQAFGDVVMFADGEPAPYRRYPPGYPQLGPTNEPYAQLLTIRFVRAERALISGTIASYWDPDRRCQMSATFVGEAKPREIDGTFTSICEDGVRQRHETGCQRALNVGASEPRLFPDPGCCCGTDDRSRQRSLRRRRRGGFVG